VFDILPNEVAIRARISVPFTGNDHDSKSVQTNLPVYSTIHILSLHWNKCFDIKRKVEKAS